jgi:hypothetical protein
MFHSLCQRRVESERGEEREKDGKKEVIAGVAESSSYKAPPELWREMGRAEFSRLYPQSRTDT